MKPVLFCHQILCNLKQNVQPKRPPKNQKVNPLLQMGISEEKS